MGESWKSLSIWLFQLLCAVPDIPHLIVKMPAERERERERGVMCGTHTTRECVTTNHVSIYTCTFVYTWLCICTVIVYTCMYILYACVYSAYIGNLYSIYICMQAYMYMYMCIYQMITQPPTHPHTHTYSLSGWILKEPVNLIDFSSSVQCLIHHTS